MRPRIDRSTVCDICERNDVAFLGIFGSYNRDDFTPESDVDLLVRFSKPKSLFDLVRIEDEFAERIGRRVDLVTEESISPYIKDRVKAETVVVYEQT